MSLGFNPGHRPSSRNLSNSLLGSVTASSLTMASSRPIVKSGMQFSRPSSSNSQSSTPVAPAANRTNMIQTDAITQRRIEYLETQLKRMNTMLQETKAEKAENTSSVPTAVVEDVYSVYGCAATDILSASGLHLAKENETVKLVYPMKKEGEKTMMRLLTVDPVTAQLHYHWVTVFEMVKGKPKRHVTNFSHQPLRANFSHDDSHTLSVVT